MKKTPIVLTILSILFLLSTFPLQATEKAIDLTTIKRIHIQVEGGRLTFLGESPDILLSPGLKVQQEGHLLRIQSPHPPPVLPLSESREYPLTIGTQIPYNEITVETGNNAVISGEVQTQRLKFQGGGFHLDQLQMEGEQFHIQGAFLYITGCYRVQQINCQGVGIHLHIQVEGTQEIQLHGVGITARIRYQDGWTGVRTLQIEGMGNTIVVEVPEKTHLHEDGYLKLIKSPWVNVQVETYSELIKKRE